MPCSTAKQDAMDELPALATLKAIVRTKVSKQTLYLRPLLAGRF